MEKVMNILEKYAQWFALGIGALFLIYMVYAYVVNPPVTVKVDPTSGELLPGQVDPYVKQHYQESLVQAMDDKKPVVFPEVTAHGALGDVGSPVAVDWKPPRVVLPESAP